MGDAENDKSVFLLSASFCSAFAEIGEGDALTCILSLKSGRDLGVGDAEKDCTFDDSGVFPQRLRGPIEAVEAWGAAEGSALTDSARDGGVEVGDAKICDDTSSAGVGALVSDDDNPRSMSLITFFIVISF